jgi:aminopeptidase N
LSYIYRKFSSATQNDLWDALTNQAYADNALQKSMSVAQIMNTWTLQTGFPVIKVARKYSDGTATLTQVNIKKKITCC